MHDFVGFRLSWLPLSPTNLYQWRWPRDCKPFFRMNEPHFDDRRVLQCAQQVVPLEKIRAHSRSRKLWFLTGAFAVAMMLGAASALLAVHIKQRSQVTQINTDLPPETSAHLETSAPTETAAAIPVESPEATAEEPLIEEALPPLKRVITRRQSEPAVADRPRVVGSRRGEVEPSEDEQLQQIRDAVLYDQWQERRMRRAARRERRNRDGRDLSHVDEIFEGPRRPERP